VDEAREPSTQKEKKYMAPSAALSQRGNPSFMQLKKILWGCVNSPPKNTSAGPGALPP
jgi:hypothetical protein